MSRVNFIILSFFFPLRKLRFQCNSVGTTFSTVLYSFHFKLQFLYTVHSLWKKWANTDLEFGPGTLVPHCCNEWIAIPSTRDTEEYDSVQYYATSKLACHMSDLQIRPQ